MIEAQPRQEYDEAAQQDFLAWEQQFQTPTPAEYLAHLPHQGFTTPEQRQALIGQIDAVGLPVDNYRSLAYEHNEKGRENVLASWGIGADNYGRFTIYERLDHEIPEERLATVAHESAHANTPLRPENAYLFGGEAERAEAAKYVVDLAGQSLITGKYLTGYQKYLAQELVDGEIDFETFAEETQAIATELAMTNRAKLMQVEDSQHAVLQKLQARGVVPSNYEAVNLVSRPDADGNVIPDGIDKQLITLVRGVASYDDLLRHVGNLKAQFYPDASLAVATERWDNMMQVMHMHWMMEIERRNFEEHLRSERNKNKKDKATSSDSSSSEA